MSIGCELHAVADKYNDERALKIAEEYFETLVDIARDHASTGEYRFTLDRNKFKYMYEYTSGITPRVIKALSDMATNNGMQLLETSTSMYGDILYVIEY